MTRTVKAQALVLPEASVAVQLTAVYPRPNWEPGAGEHTTATALSQMSVATGAKGTNAEPKSCGNSAALMLAGQMIVGGIVSCTVTVKAQPLVFPAASRARQLTALTPTKKAEPLGGAQTTVAPG